MVKPGMVFTPVMPAFRRLTQGDFEFKDDETLFLKQRLKW
jgi:hypothetical protein